jgi:hypothetical protein
VALKGCTSGLVFKKGEKILIDRTVKAPFGFVFGRIGTREGMVSVDKEAI